MSADFSVDDLRKIIKEKVGLTDKEIEQHIRELIEDLGFPITEKAALMIVARDLGIEIRQQKPQKQITKVKDIKWDGDEVEYINIKGVVIGEVEKDYLVKRDGTGLPYRQFLISDDTGIAKIHVWGENESFNNLKERDVVEFIGLRPGQFRFENVLFANQRSKAIKIQKKK